MRIACIVGAAALSALFVSGQAGAGQFGVTGAAKSEISSFKMDVRERRRQREEEHARCGEPISVAGAARITAGWAKTLAVKAWKEQVRFRYGEEWMNYDRAEVVKEQCEESSFGGSMKRCRIVARPCKEVF